MKTISIDVYEYDELSEKAQEAARDWFRQGYEFDDDCTLGEAVEQGGLLGFTFDTDKQGKPRILYTGFCCQGDGACFEGAWDAGDCQPDKVADGWGDGPATSDLKAIAAEFGRIAAAYPGASFSVTHSGRYCHENSTDFDFEHFPDAYGDDWPEDKREEYEAATSDLKDASRRFMKWIYRQLEADYTDSISDETVAENIRCNDYLFTADGKRSAIL